jgi:hypothetical protein
MQKTNGKLHYGRLTPIEHARRELFAEIPEGVTLEDILRPEFWSHYARDFKPMDLVEAFCEDGSWEASLRVMLVTDVEVKMSLRWEVRHDKVAPEEEKTETHEIKWKGPAMRFAVVRKDTGEVIKDHLYPKSQAAQYLKNHLQAIGG